MEYIVTPQDKAIIALTTQTDLTYAKLKSIIETLQDVSVIFSSDITKYSFVAGLTASDVNKIAQIDIERVNAYLNNLRAQNIQVFTILSYIYPKRLKEIYNPPVVLYAKGNLKLLKENDTLSVVGTRRCTNYGREVTKEFCKTFAHKGLVIISGLADGIDTIAHETALEYMGKTIAVIGSGFNHIYPTTNTALVEKIIDNNGLILTEYEAGETPQAFHFPARNRIIAGLSRGVLIVEAPLRSGALITKEYALECNREIFVVPGRINDIYSKGSNEVIRSCQGSIVLSADDVLEFYGKNADIMGKSKDIQLSMEEQVILSILEVDDVHYEAILLKSGFASSQLNSLLMKMELKGIIKKLPGNIYTSVKF